METVVVVGASPKPERYSYKAAVMLGEYGHRVLPINPYHQTVAGHTCIGHINELDEPVDTVTLYVRPELLEPIMPELIALKPRRVIFNPGTESEVHEAQLRENGIAVEEACTLVLLRTEQF
ncbi:CoA-binding protein [Spongiibacter sp. KMU-158]|uniref:CoA-binding protein n=1 Tax=Spongiibacter pelagi TaxID=2760804 RepID=A0A927C0X1_9GAMM|nr:CoA-binding protein [Spongiibacter pelagi]MBD2858699.1 CoA-binding protein [Spongiibacter pelagi]